MDPQTGGSHSVHLSFIIDKIEGEILGRITCIRPCNIVGKVEGEVEAKYNLP